MTGPDRGPVAGPPTEGEPWRKPYAYTPPIAPQVLAPVSVEQPRSGPPGRIRLSVFLIMLAIVTLGSGAGGYLVAHASPATTTPAVTPSATPPGPLTVAPARTPEQTTSAQRSALLGRLVKAPRGAQVLDPGGSHGVFDLDAFMSCCYATSSSERDELLARRFQLMAQRVWAISGVGYTVQLVKFASASGAQGHELNTDYAYTGDSRLKTRFTVPGTSAKAYQGTTRSGHHALYLVGRSGDTVVLIFAVATGTPDKAAAEALMRTQLGRL